MGWCITRILNLTNGVRMVFVVTITGLYYVFAFILLTGQFGQVESGFMCDNVVVIISWI